MLALVVASSGAGCSSSPEPTRPGGTAGTGTGTAGTGTAGTGTGTAGTGGTFGAGGTTGGTGGTTGGTGGSTGGTFTVGGTGGTTTTPYCDTQNPLPLPVVVTDNYVVSGYYETSAPQFVENSATNPCPARAEGAVGACLAFHWDPAMAGQPERLWVGVLMQSTANDWTGPGKCIADGAQKVVFKVRGEEGGEVVGFGAVGIETPEAGITLTQEWQTVELNISGVAYNTFHPAGGVNGALSITLDREDADTTARTFYVDDIQWVGMDDGGGEGGAGGQGAGGEGGAG